MKNRLDYVEAGELKIRTRESPVMNGCNYVAFFGDHVAKDRSYSVAVTGQGAARILVIATALHQQVR